MEIPGNKRTNSAVVVALLRGVNVGGHHKIEMAELRALCESLACGARGPTSRGWQRGARSQSARVAEEMEAGGD